MNLALKFSMRLKLALILAVFGIARIHSQSSFDSCQEKVQSMLSRAGKIRFTKPDSAFNLCTTAQKIAESCDKGQLVPKVLLEIGTIQYITQNYDSAETVLSIARSKCTGLLECFLEDKILSRIASIYYDRGQIDTAIIIYNFGLAVALDQNDSTTRAGILTNRAAASIAVSDYSSALKDLFEAEMLFNALGVEHTAGISRWNIGNIHLDQGDYKKAIEDFQRAREIFVKSEDEYRSYAILNNIALAHWNLGELDTARYYYLKAYEHIEDNRTKAFSEYGLGDVAFSDDRYDDALDWYKKAYLKYEELGNKKELSVLHGLMTGAFVKLGMPSQALRHAHAGLEMAEKDGYPIEEIFHLKNIVRLNMQSSNRELVMTFDTLISRIDSFYSRQKMEIQKEIEADYETRKNQLTIEKLEISNREEQRKHSQTKMILLFSGVAVLVGAFLAVVFWYQNKRRKHLINTLKSKQNQINLLNRELNHRVKNNLAFLTSLFEMQARRVTSDEAKDVLKEGESRLKALGLVHSNLFQSNLDNEVNLAKYLKEVCLHLEEIYRTRENDLVIDLTLADEIINAEDAMRIGLIVNELVTNSVKHAFDKVHLRRISIQALKDSNGEVHISYADNGTGYSRFEVEKSRIGDSLGLTLVQLLERQLVGKVRLTY